MNQTHANLLAFAVTFALFTTFPNLSMIGASIYCIHWCLRHLDHAPKEVHTIVRFLVGVLRGLTGGR